MYHSKNLFLTICIQFILYLYVTTLCIIILSLLDVTLVISILWLSIFYVNKCYCFLHGYAEFNIYSYYLHHRRGAFVLICPGETIKITNIAAIPPPLGQIKSTVLETAGPQKNRLFRE